MVRRDSGAQGMHSDTAPAVGETHEVFNQPAPLEPFDAWLSDTALREAVAR